MSRLYNQIRTYYLYGYGCPVKYYTDDMLEMFVIKNLITQKEAKDLKAEKERTDDML